MPVVKTKAEKPEIHFYISVHKKLSKDMHSLVVNYARDIFFSKKVMKVKNTNNSNPDECFFSDK